MDSTQKVLHLLIELNFGAQIKGKSWWSGLRFMEGMENTGRHFQISNEVVFTTEMVKSITILNGSKAVIELVG